jgi:hypothetical protein
MAEQLVACRTLIGMTHGQVVELLGNRDLSSNDIRMDYIVGSEFPEIDPVILSLRFDGKGFVREVTLGPA